MESDEIKDILTDEDREEIARLVREGFTEGKLVYCGRNIYWKLDLVFWQD